MTRDSFMLDSLITSDAKESDEPPDLRLALCADVAVSVFFSHDTNRQEEKNKHSKRMISTVRHTHEMMVTDDDEDVFLGCRRSNAHIILQFLSFFYSLLSARGDFRGAEKRRRSPGAFLFTQDNSGFLFLSW